MCGSSRSLLLVVLNFDHPQPRRPHAQPLPKLLQEAGALDLVRKWVLHAPERVSQVPELLKSGRLELCGFEALVELQEGMETEPMFAESKAQLREAIGEAVKQKLAEAAILRKRKSTMLESSEETKRHRKVARLLNCYGA